MRTIGLLLAISLACGVVAPARAAGTPLTTEELVSGLSRPVFVTHAPGDTSRIFILEQFSVSGMTVSGRIRIYNLNTRSLLGTPFLTITPVSSSNEQGLLGLAFHPDYAHNGFFYVNHTVGGGGGTTRIRRYQVTADANVANPVPTEVLSYAQPQNNHNGGWMGFGPDGYLYIAAGDGGNRDDTGTGHTETIGNAQDLSRLLGKMLRIDVDGDDFPMDNNLNYAVPPTNPFAGVEGARGEIWAYGLRNPWRPSFDRLTGDLWIADVGQDAWEEINFQAAASLGGENYGWRCREGDTCTPFTGACDCNSESLSNPVHVYAHDPGCSVTGGYVYRGARIWDLRGTYFFADYCSAQINTFRYDGATMSDFRMRAAELDPPGNLAITQTTSFGEDARGELYICDQQGGQVFRVIPNGPVVGDLNGDGAINFDDIDAFILALISPAEYLATFGLVADVIGDTNLDGACNFDDIDSFVALLISGG